jgi:F0F1-type ATP synthase membrane subunit b/b'
MQNATTPVMVIVGFMVFLTVVSVVFVDPLLNIISQYVVNSGY